MMISASSRAFVLNGETTTWRNWIRNSIMHISLPDLIPHGSADGIFGKDSAGVVDQPSTPRAEQRQGIYVDLGTVSFGRNASNALAFRPHCIRHRRINHIAVSCFRPVASSIVTIR